MTLSFISIGIYADEMREKKIVDLLFRAGDYSSAVTDLSTARLVVSVSCLLAALLQLHQFRSIFNGVERLLLGFVISNAIAFSCSFSSLFLQKKPSLARLCVLCSQLFMVFVVIMLLYALSVWTNNRFCVCVLFLNSCPLISYELYLLTYACLLLTYLPHNHR